MGIALESCACVFVLLQYRLHMSSCSEIGSRCMLLVDRPMTKHCKEWFVSDHWYGELSILSGGILRLRLLLPDVLLAEQARLCGQQGSGKPRTIVIGQNLIM